MRYAVKVQSHAAERFTKEGDWFWITDDGEYVSSSPCDSAWFHVPDDLKTFSTREKAEAFAKSWGGHPWWCKTTGVYEVVPVKARSKRVITGYRVAA